jgi:hypothetical protein
VVARVFKTCYPRKHAEQFGDTSLQVSLTIESQEAESVGGDLFTFHCISEMTGGLGQRNSQFGVSGRLAARIEPKPDSC